MNIKEVNFNKTANQVKQILNILAKKASLFFLFLIIFYFILGGILIYKYSILAERTEIYTTEKKPNTIKENVYHEILEHWNTKKIKFNEISETIYSNPFIEKMREQPAEKKEEAERESPADVSTVIPAGTEEEALAEAEASTDLKEEPTAELFFGKINTLFDYYTSQRKNFLSVDERAKIWGQEGLGETGEYQGFYNQNIKLLEQLTK